MEEILYILILLVGAALTSGGILISLKLRRRTGENYFTYYLLALVFFTVFGLYNLWGASFIQNILFQHEAHPLLPTLIRFFQYLSLPFLLAAWLMIIRFKNAISGGKMQLLLVVIIMIAAALMLILAGIFPTQISGFRWIPESPGIVNATVNLGFFFWTGISLLFFRQEKSDWAEARPVFWLGFAFLLAGSMQAPGMAYTGRGLWFDIIGLFLYFLSIPIPLIILMKSPLIRKKEEAALTEIIGFKAFCRKYEISPREAEVILEICKGKSNREISDTLFISLQTVKDHAHRIFTKTGIKSRVQLTNLLYLYRK